ncbi:hypothetical protein [Bacillus albus]|uniref:hypothetical protein n=1 Tax=Bacillus albus TaxID=2026189 RepID=UPI001020015D|nr:hypothetical protein [Bacillus albus]
MSSSKIPPHMVSWLSAEGWTAEELSFVEDNWESCKIEEFNRNAQLKVQAFMRIKARWIKQARGREREYDSKNKLQRKDSPSWFGEGINRDLFK